MLLAFDVNENLREILARQYWGNSVERWLIAACVFVGATLILGVVKRLAQHRLAQVAARTDTDFDDLFVDLLKRTKRFFIVVLALFIAKHWIDWSDRGPRLERYFHTAVLLVVWIQVGLWGRGLLDFGIGRIVRGKSKDDPARTMGTTVLSFVGQFVLWTLVLLQFLSSIDFPVASLIASMGVGGIAVALAAQNVLGDLFASITILLDKPFVVGDAVQIGDFVGTVEHIGVKTTRLRSVNGEQIVMGNNDLVSSRIRNFKRLVERRITIRVGVVYSTPHAKISAIPALLRSIVEATADARFDRSHFVALGDSALLFEVAFFAQKIEYAEMLDIQQAVILEIHHRFEQHGIEFAYPTQTIHVASSLTGSLVGSKA